MIASGDNAIENHSGVCQQNQAWGEGVGQSKLKIVEGGAKIKIKNH